MSIIEQNKRVEMVRDSLENLPEHPLPTGFTLTTFREGRNVDWENIHRLADRYTNLDTGLFRREFGEDDALLTERQFYLLDPQGNAIGTASAWRDVLPDGTPPIGRIHWVAIIPQYQGQGLAKPLLSAVCRRLRELRHTRTYLVTSTARIPAIRLYWQFGFRPLIQTEEDAEIWRLMEPHLSIFQR